MTHRLRTTCSEGVSLWFHPSMCHNKHTVQPTRKSTKLHQPEFPMKLHPAATIKWLTCLQFPDPLSMALNLWRGHPKTGRRGQPHLKDIFLRYGIGHLLEDKARARHRLGKVSYTFRDKLTSLHTTWGMLSTCLGELENYQSRGRGHLLRMHSNPRESAKNHVLLAPAPWWRPKSHSGTNISTWRRGVLSTTAGCSLYELFPLDRSWPQREPLTLACNQKCVLWNQERSNNIFMYTH